MPRKKKKKKNETPRATYRSDNETLREMKNYRIIQNEILKERTDN